MITAVTDYQLLALKKVTGYGKGKGIRSVRVRQMSPGLGTS